MKKKSFKLAPVVLLSAAAILLVSSAVGSTQAALTYYSENYSAEVTVSSIGVSLLENGEVVSRRNYLQNDKWDETTGTLLKNMLAEGEELNFGGLLGYGPVMPLRTKSPAKMINRGGRIPAPLQSLKN